MATPQSAIGGWVLFTGATGFVGQGLVPALVQEGYRLLCLVRASTPAAARTRLVEALRPWGHDGEAWLESGRVAVLRGDVCGPGLGLASPVAARLHGSIDSVIHTAGSTAFHPRADGEPARANVDGTREVFRLAWAWGCRDWHLISTAYACGRSARGDEVLYPDPPAFHNAYEQTKWRAEVDTTRTARECGARLTIYRPSVVAGHSVTGQSTQFTGIYYLFRAISLLARAVEQRGDVERHGIPLRIRAEAGGQANLVFIDDLAREFVEIFRNTGARGGIYHLTHPAPPTNAQIKRAVEAHYDVGGGRFIGADGRLPNGDRSAYEEIFADMTDAIAPYLFDSPAFDRTGTDRFVSRTPASWTDAALRRLIAGAERANWRAGPRPVESLRDPGGVASYFERFLPEHYVRARVSNLRQIDVDVRFRIERATDGDWWCRFRSGRLVDVRRAAGRAADVTYRATPAAFWRTVGGEATAADLFLSGDAQVEGDVERGLKFATILQEFVREYPCRREMLVPDAS